MLLDEVEIKDTTKSYIYALYLDVLKKIILVLITYTLFDVREHSTIAIINFPLLCGNIQPSDTYNVYV
jgi:hypothetical protein